MRADDADTDWTSDMVTTRDGVVVPVRETARRPTWDQLPDEVCRTIETSTGSSVVGARSTGTGFTPGFASRLDLADGSRVFVKAGVADGGSLHGWNLGNAYREEARKLRRLPDGIGAPGLLWHLDEPIGDQRWVVLCFEYVEGAPPRRPWRVDQLTLVLDRLAATAPVLAHPPDGLELNTFADDFADYPAWVSRARSQGGDHGWIDTVERLADESVERCAGAGFQHLDLRDDNILVASDGVVWMCDWNSPSLAAPWLDLVCVLMSARGDGHDCDAILTAHPLTREVESRSIDALLALLWLYFTTRCEAEVPPHSPHLRDHQRWYRDVVRDWLEERLSFTTPRFVRPATDQSSRGQSDESSGLR